MTTAPSETRKATGMPSRAGGTRGDGFASPPGDDPARADAGNAAIQPSAADRCSSSLRFMGPPLDPLQESRESLVERQQESGPAARGDPAGWTPSSGLWCYGHDRRAGPRPGGGAMALNRREFLGAIPVGGG